MSMIIDAHLHLWNMQSGLAKAATGGRSILGGETVQMMPPYMTSGRNTVQMLMANMDYAGVSGAVVTQEYLDGNQDKYLQSCKRKYPGRLKICSLYEEESGTFAQDGFDGLKIPAQRLKDKDLTKLMDVFRKIEKSGLFLSIDLDDGYSQTGYMKEISEECPDLKIAVGHFGMVTRENWREQIKLARSKNVYIESGGITWLFHKEFYPYPSAIKAIKEAADICGIEKLMWGSDYPRTMTAITYKMSLDFVQNSNLKGKELFLGGNAEKFYGFDKLTVPKSIKNMVE